MEAGLREDGADIGTGSEDGGSATGAVDEPAEEVRHAKAEEPLDGGKVPLPTSDVAESASRGETGVRGAAVGPAVAGNTLGVDTQENGNVS